MIARERQLNHKPSYADLAHPGHALFQMRILEMQLLGIVVHHFNKLRCPPAI